MLLAVVLPFTPYVRRVLRHPHCSGDNLLQGQVVMASYVQGELRTEPVDENLQPFLDENLQPLFFCEAWALRCGRVELEQVLLDGSRLLNSP